MAALLGAQATYAQYKSPFTIYPDAFSQRDTICAVYRPELAGYNDSAGVRASVYLFRNFSWEGYDLPIHKTDSGWVLSYVLPSGTAMIDFHFFMGDSIDKGARFPYAAVVHEHPGKMAPGGFMEWGLSRNKLGTGMTPALVSSSSLIAPNVTMIWIGKEWNDPQVVKNLLPGMARALKANYGDRADSNLQKMAFQLMKDPDLTEKQWIYLERMYENVLRDRNTADSLKKVIIAKFPGGLMDRMARISAVYLQRDSARKSTQRKEFFAEFPLDKYPLDDYLDPETGDMSFSSHLFLEMCMEAFNKHEWDELFRLLKQSPFQYLDYCYQHYCMYPFRTDHPSITTKEALDISSFIVNEVLRRVKDADPIVSGRGYIAPAEWEQHIMTYYTGIFAYHLGLLEESGEPEKAYALATRLEPYAGVKDLTFNDNYVRAMHQLKKDDEAIPFIKAAVYDSQATPAMLSVLQEDYSRIKGSSNGFLEYYQSLRRPGTIEKEHAELERSMINVPGLGFRLKDMNGHTVDLAALKGKIVVLDFWATWCFPCKSAMPGMQIAVNKYKDDSSVAFYFISTMEERPDYKKNIVSFLKEKQYDFTVLCDDERSDSSMSKGGKVFSEWAGPLKMNGIPQKVIIDQHGVVRWIASGFYGNVIRVADEVSYVVDLLKKEHS